MSVELLGQLYVVIAGLMVAGGEALRSHNSRAKTVGDILRRHGL